MSRWNNPDRMKMVHRHLIGAKESQGTRQKLPHHWRVSPQNAEWKPIPFTATSCLGDSRKIKKKAWGFCIFNNPPPRPSRATSAYQHFLDSLPLNCCFCYQHHWNNPWRPSSLYLYSEIKGLSQCLHIVCLGTHSEQWKAQALNFSLHWLLLEPGTVLHQIHSVNMFLYCSGLKLAPYPRPACSLSEMPYTMNTC